MAENTTSVHVGAVLDMGTPMGKMSMTAMSMAIQEFYAIHKNYTTRLVIHTRDSEDSEAGAAWAAFDLLRNAQVQAILGPTTSAQAGLVADFGNKAQVPVISFSATSPSLSPAEKPYFVRTALHDAHQVNAISSIIKHYGWREAVPLCEGTNHGSALMPHLVDTLHAAGIRVPHRSLISPSATDEAEAREVGLMGYGYVWIVTDSMTNFIDHLDPVVVDSMDGVLGVRPYVPNTEELRSFKARMRAKFHEENPGTKPENNVNMFGLWAYDAIWALARAAEKVRAGAQISDNSTAKLSRRLLEAISNEKFSGKIHMEGGQLKASSFQIVNVAGKKQRNVGLWSPTHGVKWQ
ncbi:hypothetical protein Taro_056708 [Colocasia esculenta]|uniref:Receptor ligand binding region domain-containing protein n=1 Tax=Colocasia esculenta TaxID=4460 RepID=A0A843XXB4_COLES|nr:hypothetical protein [Colocasia esculenta]